jgi:hypothetical protein
MSTTVLSAVGSAWVHSLNHDSLAAYDDGLEGGPTVAKLKTLLLQLGVGGETFSDALAWFRGNPDWIQSSDESTFVGDFARYLWYRDLPSLLPVQEELLNQRQKVGAVLPP